MYTLCTFLGKRVANKFITVRFPKKSQDFRWIKAVKGNSTCITFIIIRYKKRVFNNIFCQLKSLSSFLSAHASFFPLLWHGVEKCLKKPHWIYNASNPLTSKSHFVTCNREVESYRNSQCAIHHFPFAFVQNIFFLRRTQIHTQRVKV